MKKGDRVKIIGLPKEVFATVIRKGHKNHWVINIDGNAKNVEFHEKRLDCIVETTLEEARNFYDMENEENFPVLQ